MQKPSSTECTKIVEYLQKTQPDLIQDALTQIQKPEAEFDYYWQLSQVRDAFCEKRGFKPAYITGLHIGNQAQWERTVFIGICLKLYSPEVFNANVSYDLRDRFRHELAGMLEITTPNWISQQIAAIVQNFRVDYHEFKEQVNAGLDHVKEKVLNKPIVSEVQLSMLQ